MADIVKEIEITAAISADYKDAFKAAGDIAKKTSSELSALTKREADLQKMLKTSADAQAAAAAGNEKEHQRLASQAEKLAEKLGVAGKSAEAVQAELASIGEQKKSLTDVANAAKKTAEMGRLARDIKTYEQAVKASASPELQARLDRMRKRFNELRTSLPTNREAARASGFFSRLREAASKVPGPISLVASGLSKLPGPLGALPGKLSAATGGMSALTIAIGATTAAVAAAAKAIWDLGVDTIQTGDNIAKTSKQIGISAESFQELSWAVGLGGASEADLSAGLSTLKLKLQDAAGGNKKAAKAFRDLGISMNEVKSMNVEEALLRVSDALSDVEDTTKKARVMQDIFGGSSQKLTEAIKGGSEALAEARKEARASGYVMTTAQLEKAEEAADNYARMQMEIKGVTRELGVEVMPIVNEVLRDLVKLVRENKPLISGAIKAIAKGFGVVMKGVVKGIEYIGKAIEMSKKAVEFVAGIPGRVRSAFDSVGESVSGAINRMSAKFSEFRDGVATKFNEIVGFFKGIPGTIASAFTTAYDTVNEWWDNLRATIAGWANYIVDYVKNAIRDGVNGFRRTMGEMPLVGDLFYSEAERAADAQQYLGEVRVEVKNIIDARGADPGSAARIEDAIKKVSTMPGFNESDIRRYMAQEYNYASP